MNDRPRDQSTSAARLAPSAGPPVSDGPAFEPSGAFRARYRVLDELGRGQMGVVYRAVQTALNREVAVKFPLIETQQAADRFLREARMLAGLTHPNLVRVIDANLDGGRPFLVLEFVTGWSLMDYRERQETLSVPEAVGLVCQVLDGLHAAHSAGIVHRDVKSGNVLIAQDGVAKLADFGLARAHDATSLTAAGMLLGTPAYLSPEVAAGQAAGPGADLYAIGVMLFELITGRLPFTAYSAGDILAKHVHEAPPKLARFASDIPDALEEVFQRLMAKRPEQRPASALEAGRALRQAMGLSQSVSALHIPTLPPEPAAPALPQPAGQRRTGSRPVAVPVRAQPRTWTWGLGGFVLAVAVALPVARLATHGGPGAPLSSPSPGHAGASSPTPSPGTRIEAFPGAAARASAWTALTPSEPDPRGVERWIAQTDGAPMVRVPAGPSVRGSTDIGPDELPVRTIHVDEFWIDAYEVTNRLYDRFVRESSHAARERHPKQPELDLPDHPVISVTWQDAVDYCLWAGKRLPTEAEWEKAARGPEGRRYPWGNDEPGTPPQANFADPMALLQDGFELTAPVGRFPAGASFYGAYDMAGNVWEWCSDWYGDTYYATSPDRNPPGAESGRWRASRGGSHMTYMPSDMNCSYRKRGEPTARHLDQGFRCVRPGPLSP